MGRKRSNRIAQLRRRKNFRGVALRFLWRFAAWSIASVLVYYAVAHLFNTPNERHLREISKGLNEELDRLQMRYDSLEMILVNVEARDRRIFNTMFESEPYTINATYERVELYESLVGHSYQELREILASRTKTLDAKMDGLASTTEKMVNSITELGAKSSRIPAIQPIVNDQLTLLAASFGDRLSPYHNMIQRHNGVDYTIPEGTRVFATADGIIKRYTLSSSDTGKSVVVDHQNGYETIYNHLSKIDFPRNYRVKRGDIIGMSGNTGLSFSPHLHYEIRYKGVSVDPIDYFFMELSPSGYQQILRIAKYGMQSFD